MCYMSAKFPEQFVIRTSVICETCNPPVKIENIGKIYLCVPLIYSILEYRLSTQSPYIVTFIIPI